MRILGAGLLAIFLLTLLRFTILQPDVQSLLGLRGDIRLVSDLTSNLSPDACESFSDENTHTFMVRESDVWTALTGSPGYSTASFNLPKEVPVVSGVLVLDIRSELQVGAVARLRVNVNGQRRGEVILGEGVSESTVRVNLLPADFTQSELHVTLAGFGAFPQIVCRRNWNGGMIVRIDPTSRVELETEGPLTDLGDRLRSTGNPYQVQWPEAAEGNNFERMITYAVSERLRDNRTEFVPVSAESCRGAVTFLEDDLEQADVITASGFADNEVRIWPVAIAEEGDLASVKFFENEALWSYVYDLRSTPNAELPTALQLDLDVTAVSDQDNWLLTVTLNKQTIFATQLAGNTLNVRERILLPYNLNRFRNDLEIHLANSSPQDEIQCTSGSPVTAQILPTTVLIGGVHASDVSIGEFINGLTGPLQIEVSPLLNASEASSTVAFLADTFGDRVQWDPVRQVNPDSNYVFVSRRAELSERFGSFIESHPSYRFLLAWPILPEDGQLPYMQIELTDEAVYDFQLNEGPRIAALIAIKPSALDREILPSAREDAATGDGVEPDQTLKDTSR